MLFQKKYLIGHELVRRGLITQDNLDLALIEHERRGIKIGKILIARGFITEDQFVTVLSDQLEIPVYPVKDLVLTDDIIATVPAKIAHSYKILPVKVSENQITLCMSDPLSVKELDTLRGILKKGLAIVIDADSHVHAAILKYYGKLPSDEDLL